MAILKQSYESVEAIPQKYRALYTRSESGPWVIGEIEGVVPAEEVNAALAELKAERRAHRKVASKVERLTPMVEVKEELDELREAHGQIGAERVDALVAVEVGKAEAELAELREEHGRLLAENADWEAQSSVATIRDAVADAAAQSGLLDMALGDAQDVAVVELQIDDHGRVAAPGGRGVQKWLAEKRQQRPFWFARRPRVRTSLFD